VTDTDVIIVGAGPAGLMLAGELCLAGVRPLVLEKRPQIHEVPRAGGFSGQIVQLLRYRGLLEQFSAAGARLHDAPQIPFGGLHVDLALTDHRYEAVGFAQPKLERLLDIRATELGAEIRRGHDIVGLHHHDASVSIDVHGPDGPYRMSARYVVG